MAKAIFGVPLAIAPASTWRQNLAGREPAKEDFEALRVAEPATFFNAEGTET